MGGKLVEIALKAPTAGLFVLAFAALAQTLAPKRFAGLFSAAPSVALGSLLITVAFTGVEHVASAARGMQIGAAAFAVYCVAAVPLVGKLGAWRGSACSLGAWAVTATLGYLVLT
ncbi:hypothetical protein [Rugosimonospora africana]|uniref:DUF3147 family protein n=1 Tax=Rugosimonospora africana TaxID=556532 RepID=A0A8J3VX62_9ACTN|nr:hypothetical protein [Rugosimonospora africana]GIH21523.1 hypothetical protein Raf01_96950 [Rugosimonospora africana]